jgi:hypothetical protein
MPHGGIEHDQQRDDSGLNIIPEPELKQNRG